MKKKKNQCEPTKIGRMEEDISIKFWELESKQRSGNNLVDPGKQIPKLAKGKAKDSLNL